MEIDLGVCRIEPIRYCTRPDRGARSVGGATVKSGGIGRSVKADSSGNEGTKSMTKNTVIIGVAIVAGIISPETEAQPKGRGDAPREEALKEPF